MIRFQNKSLPLFKVLIYFMSDSLDDGAIRNSSNLLDCVWIYKCGYFHQDKKNSSIKIKWLDNPWLDQIIEKGYNKQKEEWCPLMRCVDKWQGLHRVKEAICPPLIVKMTTNCHNFETG